VTGRDDGGLDVAGEAAETARHARGERVTVLVRLLRDHHGVSGTGTQLFDPRRPAGTGLHDHDGNAGAAWGHHPLYIHGRVSHDARAGHKSLSASRIPFCKAIVRRNFFSRAARTRPARAWHVATRSS